MASPHRVEYMREYRRKWSKKKRAEDPEYRKHLSRKARERQLANPIQHAWNNYRRSARDKGKAFEISRERFEEFVTDKCIYCDAAPSPINGIDRVDSSDGYVEGNMVSCCSRCNIAKSTMTVSDFIRWARRVAAHSLKEM